MRRIINKVIRKAGLIRASKGLNFQHVSYSQCGEDLIVSYIFQLRGIEKPTYLDVGAHDPFYLSNTALFYEKGCTGINVEPNPVLLSRFREKRPADINLETGIGSQPGSLDFFIMNDLTLSSFNREEIKKYEATGKYKLTEIKKVSVVTIEQILEKYSGGIFPDFFSLDAEGMDYDIIKSINYNKSIPKVICVEAAEYSPSGAGERKSELIYFLQNKGYFEYANTNLNAIMVLRDFWYNE